jgi:hypothetical protein
MARAEMVLSPKNFAILRILGNFLSQIGIEYSRPILLSAMERSILWKRTGVKQPKHYELLPWDPLLVEEVRVCWDHWHINC